jgi:high-affinity iron transporter
VGQLLRALFGYSSTPEWATLVAWAAYLAIVLPLYLRPIKPSAPRPVTGTEPAVNS